MSSAAPYTLTLTYSRVAAAQPSDLNYYEAISEVRKCPAKFLYAVLEELVALVLLAAGLALCHSSCC